MYIIKTKKDFNRSSKMNCDTLPSLVSTKHVLGEGSQGKVYSMDNRTVLKVVYGSTNVDILTKAASIGIAPPIYDIRVCKEFTYYLQKRMAKPFEQTYDNQLPEIITRMIENGIFHNDVHQDNIMVDETGKLYLIDFDLATFVSDYGYTSFDRDVDTHSFWEDSDGNNHPIEFTEEQASRIYSVRPNVAKTERELATERKVEEAKKKARENLQQRIRSTKGRGKSRSRKTRKRT